MMNESYFTERGIYYRVNDFLPGRQTLVFIHGLTGSASSWWAYEKIFGENYNLLNIDLRGHGKSKKFPDFRDYEIKNFAEDIFSLLEFLRIQKFVLVSHSFGTLVALEFLRRHQFRVEAVVYISPNFRAKSGWLARASSLPLKLAKNIFGLWPAAAKPGRHIDYSRYPNVGDWSPRLNFADLANTSLRVYVFCLLQIYESGYDSFWKHGALPTLIIHGKKDTVIPARSAVRLHQQIADSRLQLVEEANHLVVLNNVSAVAAALENFFQNLKK